MCSRSNSQTIRCLQLVKLEQQGHRDLLSMDGAVVGIVATEGPMPGACTGPMPIACAGPAPLPATEGPVPLATAGPVPSSATEDHVPYVAEAYGELPLTPSQEKKLAKKVRNVNTTTNNNNNNYNNDAAAAAAASNDAIRRQNFEWSHGAVHSLLDIYEEKYSALQRGTLRGRHWHEVAQHVSARGNGTRSTKTSKQCKFKIENLKRRYKMEKAQRIENPTTPGTGRWPYFDRLDSMLGFTPKGVGGGQRECADTLSGSDPLSSQEANPKVKRACTEPALECQGESEMPAATPMGEDRDVSPDVGTGEQDEGVLPTAPGVRKDSKTDASEVNTMLNGPATSGGKGRSKLPVKNLLSNPGIMLANSITAFAEVFARIEQAKMEMHRDLERQRTEADLKRTQMVLNNQLEIAKLVARSRKRKSRSTPSSSESE